MATIETRKSAKGITYRVKVRLDGKPPASRTFARLAPAKAWAAATETALRDGTYAVGSARTLAEAIDGFLASELAGKKDQRMLGARVGWWHAELGKLRRRPKSTESRESAH